MARAKRLLLLLAWMAATAGAAPDEVGAMIAIERDTERLAYRLLDLAEALRKGDRAAARACFVPDVVVAGFPAVGTGRGPAAATDALAALVAGAGATEHVLLKPSESRRRANRLEAAVKLRVVGRREDGTIVWIRGKLETAHRPGDGPVALDALRVAALKTMERPAPLFTDVTAATGIARADPPVLEHPTLGLAAYGAAAGDVDGDGRVDLFVTAHDTNHLLLNRGGGRFEERCVPSPRVATAPLLLDYDNDGDLDVFLSANGAQMMLENRGVLGFRDVSAALGVDKETIGFSVAAGDVNGDGRPDLYVAAYNDYGPVAPDSWVEGRNGLANLFFVSRPDGTYAEEARKWGVADSRWSYAAQLVDLDGDGRLDLYVANDFGGGNALFMRRGDRFVDEARERGVRDDGYAMGVSFGDYDNDGLLDLHVTRMSSTAGRRILARLEAKDVPSLPVLLHLSAGNGLYRNAGGGRFVDVTAVAGPFPAGWAWGGGFVDIDNDGWEDLYTPNGHLSGAAAKDT